MTDFETLVIRELGEIKSAVATTTQVHVDHERRLTELSEYNKTQDSRAWIKSIVVGAAVLIGHPLARRLGLDI